MYGEILMKSFVFLLKNCWKFQKGYIIYAFLYQIIYTLMPLGTIIIPKFIIDELTGKKNVQQIIFWVVVLLLLNLFGGILKTYFQGKMFTSKNNVFNKFQVNIAEKMADCDYEQLENPHFLDIKEKAGKFLYADGRGFGVVLDDFFNILGQFFVFIGISAILFQFNPIILFIFVGLTFMNVIVEAKVKKIYVEWDMEKAPIERKTSYLLRLVEDFRYGKEIRIYNLKQWLAKKTQQQLQESASFYEKQVNTMNISIYFSVGISFIREVIAYIYSCMEVLNGAISIGTFSMYISAIAQFSQAMDSVLKSAVNIKYFSQYSGALEEYLNMPAINSKRGNKKILETSYKITFEHVSFIYPGQSEYALHDVNEIIDSNEKIAIIGENGAGKTTFVKLLLRFYVPTEGRILLNDIDYLEYDYNEYLKIFGVVFQDFNMFSFTLKDNVVFDNRKKYTDKEIIELVSQCGIQVENEEKFREGINSYINRDFEEKGIIPSGGEGQKIALARALYKNSDIVLLDEPTAALDPKAECELYELFNQIVVDKTAIFISHRLASCHFCDRILVFENGKIIEEGTHKDLMEKNGIYAETYNMQANLYKM